MRALQNDKKKFLREDTAPGMRDRIGSSRVHALGALTAIFMLGPSQQYGNSDILVSVIYM
jgi:hypothetical protein